MVEKADGDVEIVSGEPPYKYKVISEIEVSVEPPTIFHSSPTTSEINKKLIEKAREVGADAVIRVMYEKGTTLFSWDALTAKGIAVKK